MGRSVLTCNQFDRDKAELGWRAAVGLWLENRTSAPRIIGWTVPPGLRHEALVEYRRG